MLATAMMIFMLSFAGIPLTGGFIGKLYLFTAGVLSGNTILVVVAVLASAVTAVFYFRLVQIMFLRKPDPGTTVVRSQGHIAIVVGLCAIATIILGLVPGPLMGILGG